MEIKFSIDYTESETPPHCRKPRDVSHSGEIKVKIKEIGEESAPPALIVHKYSEEPNIIRLYKGKLYREARLIHVTDNGPEVYTDLNSIPWDRFLTPYSDSYSFAECKAHVKIQSSRFLIIGGVLYIRCYEPYYVIQSFGHSGDGTAIFVEYSKKSRSMVYGYSALNKRLVVKHAVEVAKSRNDMQCNQSIERCTQGWVDVLIPSVCKRKFKTQLGMYGLGEKTVTSASVL